MEPQLQKSSSSKVGTVVAVILVLAALASGYYLYLEKMGETNTNTPAGNNSGTLQGYPVPENHPAVESVALTEESYRYFFAGPIAEVVTLSQGTRVTLENSSGLPPMILPTATNPSNVTLGDGETPKVQATTHAALKKGVYVQVLMYYHIPNQAWLLRDIYIPSDKN